MPPILIAAANRDPDLLSEPELVDVTREPVSSLSASGPGPHYCLGAYLASIQGEVLVRGCCSRFPGLRQAGSPPAAGREPVYRSPGSTLRGPDYLPACLDP